MKAPAILTTADARLVETVEALYGCAAEPSRWPAALQDVADLFGDFGANLIWRRDDGSFGIIVSPAMVEGAAEYERHWWQHDIRAARNIERYYFAPGDAVTDRHLVTDEEVRTHPFYTKFLASYGLRWVAAAGISPDPHVQVALSIQRSSSKEPFGDTELALLTRVCRHAENALRLGIRLMEAETANLSLGEALSRLSIGVFLLDGAGHVALANPAGERLLGDGLVISAERLSSQFAPERDTLRQAIEAALASPREDGLLEPRPLIVRRVRSEMPLTVYVLPVSPLGAKPAGWLFTRTRAIVLVLDPTPNEPPDPTLVRDLLGITLGEARVAALVGSGTPPRETAERLGITEETARTVLKRVFAKVGISRQSELCALITKLLLR